MTPLPELVTQAQWAAHLGVSPATFLRWRRDGVRTQRSGVIEIPTPVDLPGWPRWKREDVARVSRLLINGKRRLFGKQSVKALSNGKQKTAHRGKFGSVSRVHTATLNASADTTPCKSVSGTFR